MKTYMRALFTVVGLVAIYGFLAPALVSVNNSVIAAIGGLLALVGGPYFLWLQWHAFLNSEDGKKFIKHISGE